MRSASSVTSYAAARLKGCTNLLLETLTSFTELSPYRTSGTYVFCTGNGKLTIVKNSDAVLQLLFYSAQLSSDEELRSIAKASSEDHLAYEKVLKESFEMLQLVILDNQKLKDIPLSSNSSGDVNLDLNDLGLSANARLCLRAAGEQQLRKICYYDSFKQSNNDEDFHANIDRLELAGIWDELIEMLKRYELPDGFECREEWIALATRYRRMVEPLDIANYYRHSKNEDTGTYEIRGRPKRYRFTQRWREHALKLEVDESSESCFWAKVEEYRIKPGTAAREVLELQEKACKWINAGHLGRDVFLEGSTFMEWWNKLPDDYKSKSCSAEIMKGK